MRRRGCLILLILAGALISLAAYDGRVRGPRLLVRFTEELQAGETGDYRRGSSLRQYPNLDGRIPLPPLSAEDFATRVRAVADWDRLAAIEPYGDGAEIANAAAGFNPWLQLRLRATDGFPQDGIYKVLVIDAGRVVTTLYLDDWPVESAVIEREP